MDSDSLVSPGVFELMTAVCDVDQLDAQLAGCVFKAPRLVAQFRGKEQQSLASLIGGGGERLSFQTNDSVCNNDCLTFEKGTNRYRVRSDQQYQGSFR